MKSMTRIITGIAIVVIGMLFLLTNLNIMPFFNFGDWWPMLFVVGGVLILLNDYKNYLWALILIVIGGALQLQQFALIEVNPWQLFWPIVMIAVGLSILTSRSSAKQRVASKEREDITAIFSGSEVRVQSNDFKGSKITAVCGGAMIDLSNATIKKEATIDMFAFWGGIEIRVPKGVIVKNNASLIMGGAEDHSGNAQVKDGAPVLYVIGDIVMAGVEIKRV
ncbi:MAG: LiaF transmembrane domain-containing protein [Candidatus Saccharimonadales bacterium]